MKEYKIQRIDPKSIDFKKVISWDDAISKHCQMRNLHCRTIKSMYAAVGKKETKNDKKSYERKFR